MSGVLMVDVHFFCDYKAELLDQFQLLNVCCAYDLYIVWNVVLLDVLLQ